MSNQYRNFGSDINNNSTPYPNAYGNKTNKSDKNSSSTVVTTMTSAITETKSNANVAANAAAAVAATNATVTTKLRSKVGCGTYAGLNDARANDLADKNNRLRKGKRQ